METGPVTIKRDQKRWNFHTWKHELRAVIIHKDADGNQESKEVGPWRNDDEKANQSASTTDFIAQWLKVTKLKGSVADVAREYGWNKRQTLSRRTRVNTLLKKRATQEGIVDKNGKPFQLKPLQVLTDSQKRQAAAHSSAAFNQAGMEDILKLFG